MKINSKLEEIRKRIPQSVKDDIDEIVKAIDNAYELGCKDTKQKLTKHGVMQGLLILEKKIDWIANNMTTRPITYVRKKRSPTVADGAAGKNG